MSWQDYVDKQLVASRCVTKACIAGLDGNVWAKSEGFEVSTTHHQYHPLTRDPPFVLYYTAPSRIRNNRTDRTMARLGLAVFFSLLSVTPYIPVRSVPSYSRNVVEESTLLFVAIYAA